MKKLIISIIATVVIIVGSWIGYIQYSYSKEAESIRKVEATLIRDINAINDFDKVNELPKVIETEKKVNEAAEKFNAIASSTEIDLNYAQLMLNSATAVYNFEVAASEFISEYNPKTSNQEIKDLFEDLKLAKSKRIESANELKEQSIAMFEYMKADNVFLWNEGMKYLNDSQTKYDERVEDYFDIRHQIEKVNKRLVESRQVNNLKLKKVQKKILFN